MKLNCIPLLAILLIAVIFVSGCVETPKTTPQQPTTFSSLKEIFGNKNPIGSTVQLHGIGFKLAGVAFSDFFIFTDDERVMKNPSYIEYYDPEYTIIVYNTPNAGSEQSLINITGEVIKCKRPSDGKFCIDADSIQTAGHFISV